MIKKIYAGIILIMIIIGVCGCGMDNKTEIKENEVAVTLNDRQKEILSKEGLPEVYEELNYTQKKAITAMEEMLVYTEEKYGISLEYAGYVAQNSEDPEHMYAYPTSGDEFSDTFTIERTEDGYKDDYVNKMANNLFTQYVSDAANNLLQDHMLKAFTHLYTIDLPQVPENPSDFDGTVNCEILVYISDEDYGTEDVHLFEEALSSWMREHEIKGALQVLIFDASEIEYLTKYNYTDYLSDEYYSYRETLYIK